MWQPKAQTVVFTEPFLYATRHFVDTSTFQRLRVDVCVDTSTCRSRRRCRRVDVRCNHTIALPNDRYSTRSCTVTIVRQGNRWLQPKMTVSIRRRRHVDVSTHGRRRTVMASTRRRQHVDVSILLINMSSVNLFWSTAALHRHNLGQAEVQYQE